MKNLANKIATATLIGAGALYNAGCTSSSTIHEATLRDNYQTINAPTLGVANPNVDIAQYKSTLPQTVSKAIPQKAGLSTPLETQLLYFNTDSTMPGRGEITGAAGFSIDSNHNNKNDQYMVMFVDKKTEPEMRKLGIAYDNQFDIYVDFVDKQTMHNSFGTDPKNIPLMFIEDTDNSYKAFAATSLAEAGIFTLASGGNLPGGLLWGAGSMAVKTGTHYGFKEKPENTFGLSSVQPGKLSYDKPNVEFFNNLRNKLGGNTLSINDSENGLSLFSYNPESFNGVDLTRVTDGTKIPVSEGLVKGLEELVFHPQFEISADEKNKASYMYLVGLVAAGIGGHVTGNGSDGGSNNNGGGNNPAPTPTFDVIGGPGGMGL